MTKYPEFEGHYSVVYSPDDEASSGKGYYAETWWDRRTSPLKRNPIEARQWAVKHGGTIEH